ncbi:MAG TPA: malate dehydrogenase (quinone), partial [Segetibacter sp.]
SFIRAIPHMSFVWGDENVDYLRKRYETLQQCHLFKGMEFSEDPTKIEEWIPLVMTGRDPAEKVAATRMELGTDVNFGSLTRCLFDHLKKLPDVTMHFGHDVRNLEQDDDDNFWDISVKNIETDKKRKLRAKFVFIGAGGGSLPLLIKADIPEGKGFGGFPVSGQWLRCTNREVIEKHNAKVYGTAAVGAPPMSVPHLDTRFIEGKKELLFGPYAGFSTKFLKNGSFMDLPLSIKMNNIRPMLAAGIKNLPLTKYLLDQVRQSPEDRLDALKDYFPAAKMEDWELEIAGQRVQVIKDDPEEGGVLEFGTEVVSAKDGTIAALLGASPGASTAVSIMLDLIKRCFKEKAETPGWQAKLKEMIPTYGQSLSSDAQLLYKTRRRTSQVLGLKVFEPEAVNENL